VVPLLVDADPVLLELPLLVDALEAVPTVPLLVEPVEAVPELLEVPLAPVLNVPVLALLAEDIEVEPEPVGPIELDEELPLPPLVLWGKAHVPARHCWAPGHTTHASP
jgi:hypothetical protein